MAVPKNGDGELGNLQARFILRTSPSPRITKVQYAFVPNSAKIRPNFVTHRLHDEGVFAPSDATTTDGLPVQVIDHHDIAVHVIDLHDIEGAAHDEVSGLGLLRPLDVS